MSFTIHDLVPCQTPMSSTLKALEVGYRHIDSAQFYANEAEVGEALRASGIPRDQVFVTTKILTPAGSIESTYDKVLASVEKIGGPGGYVDLFLIHSPKSGPAGRKHLWQVLERLHEEGRAKSIGVSNFGVGHIEEMKSYAKVWPPHVNQLELHPWCQQRTITAYCKRHNIVVEAYSPIVRNYKANDETLVEVAKRYNKTTQQVLLRYSLQKGWIPLPKSDNPERIASNANIFDFNLSEYDVELLDSLDQGDAGAIVEYVVNE
ncbi:aldo-keto reductase [Penicillium chermesinum]|uniref:D-xylose reductase [NAD(P)H] n=1 Tax=Penicillium chermesinum TaxID=63820 RepID=A0A9W9P6T8_9EURO|nr:aldo-keto reductase [Penicillium chermesinum]KAJ5238925.1 aldo-keto reductase [Penicillium chermesinum]